MRTFLACLTVGLLPALAPAQEGGFTIKMLANPDPAVRQATLDALDAEADQTLVPVVRICLNDRSADVRKAAAQAIGRMSGEEPGVTGATGPAVPAVIAVPAVVPSIPAGDVSIGALARLLKEQQYLDRVVLVVKYNDGKGLDIGYRVDLNYVRANITNSAGEERRVDIKANGITREEFIELLMPVADLRVDRLEKRYGEGGEDEPRFEIDLKVGSDQRNVVHQDRAGEDTAPKGLRDFESRMLTHLDRIAGGGG